MMLKWGKVFLLLVWLLSNQAEWLRCVFHHRMLTFISIRNSSEPAASQPASGATFEMQIFDQNSYSFLRVAVPLLLPPTTCLRQSRRLSVVWGKAFTSDSSSAQTCCSCPRTTVPESFISAKPAITDVSSHLKLKRWFFIIIIIIISMLGTSGKWNNKVHKKKTRFFPIVSELDRGWRLCIQLMFNTSLPTQRWNTLKHGSILLFNLYIIHL